MHIDSKINRTTSMITTLPGSVFFNLNLNLNLFLRLYLIIIRSTTRLPDPTVTFP